MFKKTFAGVMSKFKTTVDDLNAIVKQKEDLMAVDGTKMTKLNDELLALGVKQGTVLDEIKDCTDTAEAIQKLFPALFR